MVNTWVAQGRTTESKESQAISAWAQRGLFKSPCGFYRNVLEQVQASHSLGLPVCITAGQLHPLWLLLRPLAKNAQEKFHSARWRAEITVPGQLPLLFSRLGRARGRGKQHIKRSKHSEIPITTCTSKEASRSGAGRWRDAAYVVFLIKKKTTEVMSYLEKAFDVMWGIVLNFAPSSRVLSYATGPTLLILQETELRDMPSFSKQEPDFWCSNYMKQKMVLVPYLTIFWKEKRRRGLTSTAVHQHWIYF